MKKISIIVAATGICLALAGCRKDDLEGILLNDTVLSDPDLTWSSTSYTATYGGDNAFRTLTYDGTPSVRFSSSNTSVATIGSGADDISLVAAGTTVITAYCEEDDKYLSDSAVYTLTVQTGSAGLTWSCGNGTSYYVDISSSGITYPTLAYPSSLTISYSSGNSSVATINSSTGAITLVGEGETTITATAEATAGSRQVE